MTVTPEQGRIARSWIEPELAKAGQELIYLTVGGSHAYGTDHELSDVDFRGVYEVEPKQLLGLRPPNNPKPFERMEPDDVIVHELGKFLRQALGNNPNILEYLFSPVVFYERGDFAVIRAHRNKLLSQQAKKTYGGYAVQQVERFKRALRGEGNTAGRFKPEHRHKHLMHTFRLIDQCTGLLKTGELDIVVHNKEELIELSEKAYEDWDFFEAEYTKRMAKLESVETKLPQQGDVEFFDKLLIDLRMERLRA